MTILSAQTIEDRVMHGRQVGLIWSQRPHGRLDIHPFIPTKQVFEGMSYGLTAAGYDIRVGKIALTQKARAKIVQRDPAELMSDYEQNPPLRPMRPEFKPTEYTLEPGEFLLCASMERFEIPHDLQAIVHDKSTLARQGIALQNTVLEPGWKGYITLELSNHGPHSVVIRSGQPIAQVVFHLLDAPTNRPYTGKYQDQPDAPTAAIHEPDELPPTNGVAKSNEEFGGGRLETGIPPRLDAMEELIQDVIENSVTWLESTCSVCGEAQMQTSSGITCINGHGGA